jgi:DsbC/DsbD-like thiol-disulfide interchange protein
MLWLLPIIATTALHAPAQPPADKSLVKASLLAHDTKVKPGDTVQLAVVLDVAKDWHIYWPGQNESGMATTVELTFPAGSGLTAGPVSFPVPKRHVEAGDIINYIHEGKVVLTVPVNVPATTAAGGSFKITANVSYLVCKDMCMPGEAAATVTIITADKAATGPDAKTIDDARATQPKAQSDGFDAAVETKWEKDTLVLTAKDASVTKVAFHPAANAAKLLDPIKTGEAKGKALRLTFDHTPKAVEGVVELTAGNTTKSWTLNLPRRQPAGATPSPAKPETPKAPAEKPITDTPATPGGGH